MDPEKAEKHEERKAAKKEKEVKQKAAKKERAVALKPLKETFVMKPTDVRVLQKRVALWASWIEALRGTPAQQEAVQKVMQAQPDNKPGSFADLVSVALGASGTAEQRETLAEKIQKEYDNKCKVLASQPPPTKSTAPAKDAELSQQDIKQLQKLANAAAAAAPTGDDDAGDVDGDDEDDGNDDGGDDDDDEDDE